MRSGVFAFALGIHLAACGGGETGPSPLRFTLDDMFIAAVPLPEQQAVIEAKKDYDVARMEHAKAEVDLNDVMTKIEISRNETEQALLAEKSAQAEQRAADKSADLTRKNNADRELRTAQLGRRAADAKTDFLKVKRAWLKRLLRSSQYGIYAKEAKWQLEKARVAQAKNIRPAGFDFGNFERQYKERSEASQRERVKADSDKVRADEKRKAWEAKEKEYLAAKGMQPGSPTTAPGASEGTSSQTPAPTTTSTDNKEPLR